MADRKEIYAGLCTKLLAASAVTAIVSTRVYQGWLPRGLEDEDYPCVTLWEVSSEERSFDQGPFSGSWIEMQIDLWGRDADVLMTLEAAVRAVINGGFDATGWRIPVSRVTNSQRMWDPDPLIARRMLQARVKALPS